MKHVRDRRIISLLAVLAVSGGLCCQIFGEDDARLAEEGLRITLEHIGNLAEKHPFMTGRYQQVELSPDAETPFTRGLEYRERPSALCEVTDAYAVQSDRPGPCWRRVGFGIRSGKPMKGTVQYAALRSADESGRSFPFNNLPLPDISLPSGRYRVDALLLQIVDENEDVWYVRGNLNQLPVS